MSLKNIMEAQCCVQVVASVTQITAMKLSGKNGKKKQQKIATTKKPTP